MFKGSQWVDVDFFSIEASLHWTSPARCFAHSRRFVTFRGLASRTSTFLDFVFFTRVAWFGLKTIELTDNFQCWSNASWSRKGSFSDESGEPVKCSLGYYTTACRPSSWETSMPCVSCFTLLQLAQIHPKIPRKCAFIAVFSWYVSSIYLRAWSLSTYVCAWVCVYI